MTDGMFFGMIVGGIALGVILAVSKARDGKLQLGAKVQTSDLPPSPRDLNDVLTLVQAQKKIEAIKALRELTGMNLVDAKAAVEKMERDGAVDPALMGRVEAKYEPAVPVGGLDARQVEQVREIARNEGQIQALKHVREITGLGLAEAKTLLERVLAG